MVLPAPAKIQAAKQKIDYRQFSGSSPESIEQLQNCVQRIAYRLQSLEIAAERMDDPLPAMEGMLSPIGDQVRTMLEEFFRCSATPQSATIPDLDSELAERLSIELRTRLDSHPVVLDKSPLGARARSDLYSLLGSVRGLIEAMTGTREVMRQIHWQQLAAARF